METTTEELIQNNSYPSTRDAFSVKSKYAT